MSNFRIYLPICKIDKDQRTVGGWATTEQLDKQNEVVDYGASKEAFGNWGKNLREMHEPKAVGRAIDVQYDDEGKRVYVVAKISKGAEDTWEKVKDGTLTGFSIGGQTIDKVSQIIKDTETGEAKQATRITKYKLNELSLVDNPANPEAKFDLVKSVGDKLLQTQIIEDEVPEQKAIRKYNGGEYETMALSRETLTKISNLVNTLSQVVKGDWEDPNSEVGNAKQTPRQGTDGKEVDEGDRVGKADGDWEDPNSEVGGAKKTPKQTTEGKEVTKAEDEDEEEDDTEKADMETDSDLQTQEEDGSDAAPVTKICLCKVNADGEHEEIDEEEAEKMLKADMESESDLQTQDEDGSDAAPVKKRRARKQVEEDQDEDDKDEMDKAYDEDEDEEESEKRAKRKVVKQEDEDEDEEESDTAKTVLRELQSINKRLTKLEKSPLPRKYRKIEKNSDEASVDTEDAEIKKAEDALAKAQEESRITGRPLSPEMEKRKEWLLDKRLERKFGGSSMRKV